MIGGVGNAISSLPPWMVVILAFMEALTLYLVKRKAKNNKTDTLKQKTPVHKTCIEHKSLVQTLESINKRLDQEAIKAKLDKVIDNLADLKCNNSNLKGGKGGRSKKPG